MIVAVVGNAVPGICGCPTPYPDTGIIISGTPSLLSGGVPVSQVGTSLVLFSCGTAVISGTNQLLVDGMPVGELGYTAAGGCPTGIVTATSTLQSA